MRKKSAAKKGFTLRHTEGICRICRRSRCETYCSCIYLVIEVLDQLEVGDLADAGTCWSSMLLLSLADRLNELSAGFENRLNEFEKRLETKDSHAIDDLIEADAIRSWKQGRQKRGLVDPGERQN
jgi:hypothetical protein